MRNDFLSSGRAVSDLKAHLVLTTKYRRKVFTGEMLKRLHEILYDLRQKWDCKLIEFNGEVDHVYLFFQYYLQMDLSKFVTTSNWFLVVGLETNLRMILKRFTGKMFYGMNHISLCRVAALLFLFCVNTLKIKILPPFIPTLALRIS